MGEKHVPNKIPHFVGIRLTAEQMPIALGGGKFGRGFLVNVSDLLRCDHLALLGRCFGDVNGRNRRQDTHFFLWTRVNSQRLALSAATVFTRVTCTSHTTSRGLDS